jgi:hypothetical protein
MSDSGSVDGSAAGDGAAADGAAATNGGEAALSRLLTAAGVALLVVLGLMLAFTVAGAPAGETVVARLAALAAGDRLYRLGFFFASLLPAAMVPLMAGLALLADRRDPRARPYALAGALLVAAYAPLSAAAYASQYTVFSWLLERDLTAAATWYFDNEHGAVLTFDLLAYAIWGTGAMLVARPLLSARGVLRALAWTLAASGATSVAAFGLHALDSAAAVPLSAVSGALTAPLAVLTILTGRALLRAQASP